MQTILTPEGATGMQNAAIIAASPHLPSDMDFDDWLETGRGLAQSKKEIDWHIGDWITYGRKNFADQIQDALPGILDDERQIKRIEKTVQAFPPHLRDTSLSFDHHAHVADMPTQQALPLLKEASEQHMPARKLRIKAMMAKMDAGQIMPRDDDPEYDSLMACIRAWNRAPKDVREDFAEMVAESGLGVIDP